MKEPDSPDRDTTLIPMSVILANFWFIVEPDRRLDLRS